MQSKAATVDQYLAELPADRREAVQTIRKVILDNLDAEYEEGMQYGMIGYYVPHRVFPPGYHCDPRQPLPFAALGSQKNHMAIYLMCLYGHTPLEEWFRGAWAKAGKKLDMGKCCVRFKKLEDVALDVVAETMRRVPAAKYVAYYEEALKKMGKSVSRTAKPARAAATGGSPKSKAAGRRRSTASTAGKKSKAARRAR